MSAKEFYHKDVPSYTPNIPPELWGAIIQHAVHAPGGYELDLMTLEFGVPATTVDKARFQSWKTSLITRRSVVRVNKVWYALGSPYLYEYIILGRGRVLRPLLDGMERTQEAAASDNLNRPIGWWTKRLDVNMRDSPNTKPHIIMDTLADILSHMPNLRILTFSITGHRYRPTLPSNVLRSLVCRDTLHIVHWYTDQFPSITTWSDFLKDFPHVESVNANEVMNSRMAGIQLDSLKIVHAHGRGFSGETTMTSHMWALSLPAVRYATYAVEFSDNHEQVVRGFFAAVGGQLQVIQLNDLRSLSNDMELEIGLEITFEEILLNCPALQQINLHFYSWHMLGLYVPIFPDKVITLVIRILKGQLPRSEATHLFLIVLTNLKTQNPQLKTIQFYSNMNIRNLRRHPRVLSEGLRHMHAIGLSILDDEGNIMR